MTPPPPRQIERPWQRDAPSTGPQATTSAPSLPAAVSSLEDALARALPGALAELERRLKVHAQGLAHAQQSAVEHTLTMRLRGWHRIAAALGLLAGTAIASCVTRLVAEREIAAAAEVVATEVAASETAELGERHDAVAEVATANAKRLDALEPKVDQILQLLQRPAVVEVPAPAPAKVRRR